jgi:hypothetical protein
VNGIDWGGPDVVLACQLICATTLSAHLLILRPRAARRDLLFDARVVQDELDLAERLGHVDPLNVETIAVQQLLRRVRQNPRSAGLVLARIPALARSAAHSTRRTDVEYLGGALDRLSDAAQRYLRGAWPRAGTLSTTVRAIPPTVWDDGRQLDLDDADPYPSADELYLIEDDEGLDFDDAFDAEFDAEFEDDDDESADEHLVAQLDENLDVDLDSDLDVSEPAWTAAEEQARPPRRDAPGPVPITVQLSEASGSPAWVDLVQAETPRRNAGLGLADRHARPYRPARSSGHSAARRIEQPDHSSVLPR